MLNNFLIALPLTILIETVILFMVSVFWNIDKNNFSNRNLIFAGIFASSLTLPYLYFVLPSFLSGFNYISFGELFVTFIEGIFYMFFFRITFLKGLFISFLANLTSFLVGVLIFWF